MTDTRAASYRVLVADDDSRVRDSLACLLRHEGFRTLPVEGGQKAVQVIRRQVQLRRTSRRLDLDPREEIHFLVLDYNMPDLSGLEVLRELAALERGSEEEESEGTEQGKNRISGLLPPAIMVSGEASRDLERDVVATGGFALLEKPVRPDAFREIVWRLVRTLYPGPSAP